MKEKLLRLMYHATCESELEGKTGSCPYRKHGRCGEIERMDLCAITHLAEELLANGVTVQEWIPVTERLPEEWEAVLVCSWCGFCETAVYLGVPGKWRVTWDHTMMDDGIVTHWMPLPKPPKEG